MTPSDSQSEQRRRDDAVELRLDDDIMGQLRALGWRHPALHAQETDQLRADVARLEAERDALRRHILDIDAHATPFGDIPDEPGWIGTYLVTAGSLHRALGKIGHSAPACQAEADLDLTRQAVDEIRESHRLAEERLTAFVAELQATVARLEAERVAALEEVVELATELTEERTLHQQTIRDRDEARAQLGRARGVTRRLTSVLIANASRLDTPFSNAAGSPWDTAVKPALNNLRVVLGLWAGDRRIEPSGQPTMYEDRLDELKRERDEARAEIQRIWEVMRNSGAAARESVDQLVAERDEARAELAAYRRPGIPTYEQLSEAFGSLLEERDEWRRVVAEQGAENEAMRPVVEASAPIRDRMVRSVESTPAAKYDPDELAFVDAVDRYLTTLEPTTFEKDS